MRHQMVLTGLDMHLLVLHREIQAVNRGRRTLPVHAHVKAVPALRTAQLADVPVQLTARLHMRLLAPHAHRLHAEILHLVQHQPRIFPHVAVKLPRKQIIIVRSAGMHVQRHHRGSIVIDQHKNLHQRRPCRVGKLHIQQELPLLAHLPRDEKHDALLRELPQQFRIRIARITFC